MKIYIEPVYLRLKRQKQTKRGDLAYIHGPCVVLWDHRKQQFYIETKAIVRLVDLETVPKNKEEAENYTLQWQ